MSAYIWTDCDRCGKEFKFWDLWNTSGMPVGAGGYRFFNKDGSPSIWNWLQQNIEEIVCRDCMWADEEFLNKYPHMRREHIRKLIIERGMK